MTDAARGEVWQVRFDPSEGDEIQKSRPAVVISVASAGRMQLQIVVPITNWRDSFTHYFWMVPLQPDASNGLTKPPAADAFQVKSLSVNRLQSKLGELPADTLAEIAAAIALCVGYGS